MKVTLKNVKFCNTSNFLVVDTTFICLKYKHENKGISYCS